MAATTTQTRSNERRSVEELKKELPPDWELVTSPDVKKPYYWNKRTNETSWKFPRAEAEAHKAMVEEHLYQNVQLRTRTKSTDDRSAATQSPKPNDKKHSSVPPQTPPPPVGPKPGSERPLPLGPPPPIGPKPGAAEYSIISHDWIEKKKLGAQKASNKTATSSTSSDSALVEAGSPPALPPRSELSDQLDEDLYDLPIIHEDSKKSLPSDKTATSSSSVTMNNILYDRLDSTGSDKPDNSISTVPESEDTTYDVIADVKKSPVKKADGMVNISDKKSSVERKTPNNSPQVTKKMTTLPKAASSDATDATYDVVADVQPGRSLTMPAANRRSPSPEYAVIRKSPVLSHAVKDPVNPNSPVTSRAAVVSAGEYDYISHSAVKEAKKEDESKESEYDLPVTARQAELRINSPPSPMLSNYAKLQQPKDGVRGGKQEWQIPKQTTNSKKKTSKSVSIDVAEANSHSGAADSVDKAIEELQKGLKDDSDHAKHRVHSLNLSTAGDVNLDWDDSDMPAEVSAIQQAWMEKHQLNLVMRSYEQVELPPETNSNKSPSLPEKLRHGWSPRGDHDSSSSSNEKLPPGWSKVIGEDGVYYWHVKSGKTQWTLPTEAVNTDKLTAGVDDDFKELNSTLDELQMHTVNYAAALTSSNDSTEHDAPKTFRATALGWEEVDETELVKGQMVNVVHACIRRISVTKGDNLKDAMAIGGQGKEVFLQIHGMELRLLDPKSSTVLSTQQINKIRVWGIGKDNERDFGYIARDQSTHKHKCHVFRCQVPAQAVARALVDNHSKAKKSKHEMADLNDDPNSLYIDTSPHEVVESKSNHQSSKPAATAADDDHDDDDAITESSMTPVPTENESYQRFECTYLGKVETNSAYGIDTIVESLTQLSSDSQQYRWIEVFMDIASSHIKILDRRNEDLLQEHRVRFLSFLGINPKDEKYCGYIMDNGDSQFVCHGFMVEPNTNKMSIALHGACQARFQRVLDAQPQQANTPKEERRPTFSLFKKKTSKKQPGPPPPSTKSNEPLYKYTVQLLGSLPIAQSANLDNVKECVQQLTEKFKSSQAKQTTGDFEILSSGITVVGHQKKLFAKKQYSFKNITYCVKLKNNFAFVYRESSTKCTCHVYAELEVDAATIVCAIQRTIMPLLSTSS